MRNDGEMRRVVVSEFVSLDGVMEDPGGAEGFEHGGWTFPYWSDEIGKVKLDEILEADALLLGRVTYEGFADRMNSLPKFVASTTLKEPGWQNSTVLEGDIAQAVATLKERPGQDVLVTGSRQLVQTLAQHDLVDEYRLLVYPIVLGSGKRLFGEGTHAPLRLRESRAFASGVVLLSYEPERAA